VLGDTSSVQEGVVVRPLGLAHQPWSAAAPIFFALFFLIHDRLSFPPPLNGS